MSPRSLANLRSFKWTNGGGQANRRRCLPSLEALEDRWCPVIVGVNTLQDAAGSAEVRTLRYAINQVNANADANNTIHFDDCPNGNLNLQTPLPPITHSAGINKIVEIRGRGRANLNVTRNVMQAFRIFEVAEFPADPRSASSFRR